MTMKPSELLPNDHFLSKVVEHALFTMNKCYQYNWDSNYVMLNLDDPFRQQKSTSARPVSEEFDTGKFSHVADAERQLSRTTSIRTFNNTLSISGAGTVTTSKPTTIRKANADSAQEFFGVLLSQIFLILSVLSKGDDLLTLPVASNLHHLPSIGHGTSFVVRKVPREYISGLPDSLLQAERFFVYKSLRHYNRKPGDEQDADGRATRLKTILLEIQVLTHSPLRSHDNIVRLIGFGWETNRIDPHSHVFQWPFLVLEYALYGSMVDAFERHAMDYSTRQNMCIDVGQGLLALHKCEVVHGDIKMENILVFPHRDKGFVAKLADFGCTLLNSEENAPRRQLPGYTKPWNAPEYLKRMSREELPLTDIYSYGLLVWRTMCYGHAPFTENQGLLPFNKHEWIAKLKDEDQLLVVALRSLKLLEPFGDFVDDINGALENSLQLDPAKRCLVSCIRALGGQVLPCSDAPLKQVAIPSEQGLGIYEYDHHNLRLRCQLRHALESYCLSEGALGWPASRTLVSHGSSTLFVEYIEQHFSGDKFDVYHKIPTLALAVSWLAVSAGTGETSSAEALFPMFSTFSSVDDIPCIDILSVGAALGLQHGSEFILQDIVTHAVPRKEEFLEAFQTRFCRGSGLILGVPVRAFDGSGPKHFPQYLGEPFRSAGREGIITPEYLLRISAAWGCLDTIKSILSDYRADINSQDFYGETALLKACRAGHVDVVRWLLKAGKARGDISTTKGITPLHWLNSFRPSDIRDITNLLVNARANPNAIAVDNDEDFVEADFFFFKGPPLMRVVASGNTVAVQALLDFGADPTLRDGVGESPIIFATRRLRLAVLRLLLMKVPNYQISRSTPNEDGLLKYVFRCPPAYGVKIHGDSYFKALEETFDFLWTKIESPARLFRAVNFDGHIPIQIAVLTGNLPLTKKIVESCPKKGHLKELVVTIGLQSAIVSGRDAILHYCIEQGGLPLHPFLVADPDEVDQFQLYVLDGPWTMNLANHQRKTTALHLCARAGDSAAKFGKRLLATLLPASRWERTPEHLRHEDHINCACVKDPVDDPVVDCRDELDRTPFFCALEAEEYELAYQLYIAGANSNATVVPPFLQTGRPMRTSLGALPIVEIALTWVSAYRAIHFLIHRCWGCLRLTNSYGVELRTSLILKTENWPPEEAAILFNYIMQRGYPNHTWDKELVLAVECLNEAAVAIILRKPDKIPKHSTPLSLYDAVRRTLIASFRETLTADVSGSAAVFEHQEERILASSRACKILALIRNSYPDHGIGGSYLAGYGQAIMTLVRTDLVLAGSRYRSNAIGPEKLINEVDGILAPWIMVMGARASPVQLLEVQQGLREIMTDVCIIWHMDKEGKGVCREGTRLVADSPQTKPDELRQTDLLLRNRHSAAVGRELKDTWRNVGQADYQPYQFHEIEPDGEGPRSVRRWMRDKLHKLRLF